MTDVRLAANGVGRAQDRVAWGVTRPCFFRVHFPSSGPSLKVHKREGADLRSAALRRRRWSAFTLREKEPHQTWTLSKLQSEIYNHTLANCLHQPYFPLSSLFLSFSFLWLFSLWHLLPPDTCLLPVPDSRGMQAFENRNFFTFAAVRPACRSPPPSSQKVSANEWI